jgi:uncharacterized membrane protein
VITTEFWLAVAQMASVMCGFALVLLGINLMFRHLREEDNQ